jgi:hypothetical protein
MKSSLKKRRRWFIWISMIAVGFLIPFLDGCGYYFQARRATKKLTREYISADKDFRKTIGIAQFNNQTYYNRIDVDAVFQAKLVEILGSACPNLQIYKPKTEQYPVFMQQIPRQTNGRVDNLKLATSARQYGFDGIVTGSVVDIAAYEEKRGIYWLRDTHHFVQIQIYVEAFDTETGAKLLDENFIREVEIDESDWLLIRQKKQAPIEEIPRTLEYIATLLGEKICDALSGQRWKSYIISNNEKQVIIPSGRIAGLKNGMLLEVFDSTRMMKGIGTERFFLPGKKIGEIKITDVYADKSEAVIVEGDNIQIGSVVKIKDDSFSLFGRD